MILSDSIWFYMILYDSIWFYMILIDSKWLYMILYICIYILYIYMFCKLKTQLCQLRLHFLQMKTIAIATWIRLHCRGVELLDLRWISGFFTGRCKRWFRNRHQSCRDLTWLIETQLSYFRTLGTLWDSKVPCNWMATDSWFSAENPKKNNLVKPPNFDD